MQTLPFLFPSFELMQHFWVILERYQRSSRFTIHPELKLWFAFLIIISPWSAQTWLKYSPEESTTCKVWFLGLSPMDRTGWVEGVRPACKLPALCLHFSHVQGELCSLWMTQNNLTGHRKQRKHHQAAAVELTRSFSLYLCLDCSD